MNRHKLILDHKICRPSSRSVLLTPFASVSLRVIIEDAHGFFLLKIVQLGAALVIQKARINVLLTVIESIVAIIKAIAPRSIRILFTYVNRCCGGVFATKTLLALLETRAERPPLEV